MMARTQEPRTPALTSSDQEKTVKAARTIGKPMKGGKAMKVKSRIRAGGLIQVLHR